MSIRAATQEDHTSHCALSLHPGSQDLITRSLKLTAHTDIFSPIWPM